MLAVWSFDEDELPSRSSPIRTVSRAFWAAGLYCGRSKSLLCTAFRPFPEASTQAPTGSFSVVQGVVSPVS